MSDHHPDTIPGGGYLSDTDLSNSPLQRILSLLGPLFFIAVQFSSILATLEIIRRRNVGKLAALPFVSLFTNCYIWTLYGILRNDHSILLPNGLGNFVGAFCMIVYHQNTPVKPLKEYTIGFLISLLCSLLYLSNNPANNFGEIWIGRIGCILSIILSGSPLASIQTVIREKSTASLPFVLSHVLWANNLSWILYGYLVANDIYIYGPNMLSFTLSSIQVGLFWLYPAHGLNSGSDKSAVKEQDIEENTKHFH
jgi:uncharacterized protein with PQ loop repeat